MNFSTKELVNLAVFGALWGGIEISLGSVLKALHLPFSGAVLAAMGLPTILVARLFVPRPGATLFMGVIAMILKLISFGGVIFGPMIGILSEAILAELVLSSAGRPSRTAFLSAGVLGVCWTLVQPFVTGLLLFGRDMLEVWLSLLSQGGRLLGLGTGAAAWVMAVLLILHILLGILCGWLAWEAGKQLGQRLSGNAALPSRSF